MKKGLIFLLCALIAMPVLAQTTYPVKRNVEINTSAKRMVTPNKFYLQIVIKDNAGAGRKGIEKTEKEVLVPTLRKNGVDVSKQLTYRDFQSEYVSKTKIVLSKSYQLILMDSEQLNNIIEALRQAGIADVDIFRAVYTDSPAVLDSLKTEAIQRARKNAEIIAAATGDEIGEVLYVRYYDQNYDNYYRPVMMSAKGAMADQEAAVYEPISFRDIELSVSMNIVYELVD